MGIIRAATISAAFLAVMGCTTMTAEPPVRVEMITDAGRIMVELESRRAPVTVCNFLGYVRRGDYDGGAFFRAVTAATNANPNPIDVIQAATPRGSDDDSRPPIVLERTSETGLSHIAGTISMARNGPDTATSSVFIVTQDTPSLDFGGARNPDGQGFAAFGRVVEGLDIARAIQAMPTNEDEQLIPPVTIRSARALGGLPLTCPL